MEPSWDDIEAFLGRLGSSWGHPGPSWRRLGAVLALSWASFEPSMWEVAEIPKTLENPRKIIDFCFPGDPPGRPPGRLGSLPGPLGALLGRLGVVLGQHGGLLVRLDTLFGRLGCLGAILGRPGAVLGRLGAV